MQDYLFDTAFELGKDAYLAVHVMSDKLEEFAYIPLTASIAPGMAPSLNNQHPKETRIFVVVQDRAMIQELLSWSAVKVYPIVLDLMSRYPMFQWLYWLHDAPAFFHWENDFKNYPQILEALAVMQESIKLAYDCYLQTVAGSGGSAGQAQGRGK